MKALCIGGPWDGAMVDMDRGAKIDMGVELYYAQPAPRKSFDMRTHGIYPPGVYDLFRVTAPGFDLAFYVFDNITSTAALHRVFAHYNKTVGGGKSK